MQGYLIHTVPKRTVDFGGVASGATQELVLADRVEVVNWRKLTMLVRLHSNAIGTNAGNISFTAYAQSWSADDPALTFLDRTGPFWFATVDWTTIAPAYLQVDIQTVGGLSSLFSMGPMMQIVAAGTRSAAGFLAATVTIDVLGQDA